MNSREAFIYTGGIIGALGLGFVLRGCIPTTYTYAEWAAMEAQQTIVAAGQGLPPLVPELPPSSPTTSTEFLPLGPSATAAPTPQPEPTDLIYGTATATSDKRPGETDIVFADGETGEVPEGCVVRGDIEPVEDRDNRTTWHDDQAGTALVTIFEEPQVITAPWGASGTCTNPEDESRIRELAEELLNGDTGSIRRYPTNRGQGE